MIRYRSSNTVIRGLDKHIAVSAADRSSYKGVAFKTLFLALVSLASAIVFAVLLLNNATTEFVYWVLPISSIFALISALVAVFFVDLTPVFGTVYCVLQGVVMGALSALIEQYFPGVALMALLSTMGVFTILMVCYATGIIKVGNMFRSIVTSCLIGVIVFVLVASLVAMFNEAARELMYGDSIFAFVLSGILVLLASAMILVDLSNIDATIKNGLHKKYEWMAAFGLIVTLIWLYLEFLRFFSIAASRSSK